MTIRLAQASDIDSIMRVENDAFIESIRENQTAFMERLDSFPQGFVLALDDEKNVIGYFCSELWENFPDSDRAFSLGHSAKKSHCKNGKILYISSFALLKKHCGKGEGRHFFSLAVDAVCNCVCVDGIALIVNSLWKNAIRIYESNGFEAVRTVENFFPTIKEGVFTDGIYMKKERVK